MVNPKRRNANGEIESIISMLYNKSSANCIESSFSKISIFSIIE